MTKKQKAYLDDKDREKIICNNIFTFGIFKISKMDKKINLFGLDYYKANNPSIKIHRCKVDGHFPNKEIVWNINGVLINDEYICQAKDILEKLNEDWDWTIYKQKCKNTPLVFVNDNLIAIMIAPRVEVDENGD